MLKGWSGKKQVSFLAVLLMNSSECQKVPSLLSLCVRHPNSLASHYSCPLNRRSKQGWTRKGAAMVKRSLPMRGLVAFLSCTAVAEPQGDFGLLEQALAAMNHECA